MVIRDDPKLTSTANFSRLLQTLAAIRFVPTKKDLSKTTSKGTFSFALTAVDDGSRSVTALSAGSMVVAGTIKKPEHGRLIGVLAVVEGELSLSIRNWSANAGAGEFLIFDPTYHPFVLVARKRVCLVWIIVPTEVFFTHAGFLFDDLPQQAFSGSSAQIEMFASAARAMYRGCPALQEPEILELSDSVLGFLRPVLRRFCAPAERHRGHSKDSVRQRALSVMAAHLQDRNLTVDSIAREVGVSARYLSSAFQATGSTVMEHLYNLRLRSAAVHLQESHMMDKMVREIAELNGFATQQHFSRLFRRKYSMSPSEWRAGAAREPQATG